MPSTHRTYDKDFRQEAVNLLLSSGRPLKRVAAELGVTANFLRTWRDCPATVIFPHLATVIVPHCGEWSFRIFLLLLKVG